MTLKHKLLLISGLTISVAAPVLSLSCSEDTLGYRYHELDRYGNKVPLFVQDIDKYLKFVDIDESIKSTTAEVAMNSINNADLNQKIHALSSFTKPLTNYYPKHFQYDIKAALKSVDGKKSDDSLIVSITVTNPKDGDKKVLNIELDGFKKPFVLDKTQRRIFSNNLLTANGLKYLITDETGNSIPDSELSANDIKNRTNGANWSKKMFDKYNENVFPDQPVANFYYSTTFDNIPSSALKNKINQPMSWDTVNVLKTNVFDSLFSDLNNGKYLTISSEQFNDETNKQKIQAVITKVAAIMKYSFSDANGVAYKDENLAFKFIKEFKNMFTAALNDIKAESTIDFASFIKAFKTKFSTSIKDLYNAKKDLINNTNKELNTGFFNQFSTDVVEISKDSTDVSKIATAAEDALLSAEKLNNDFRREYNYNKTLVILASEKSAIDNAKKLLYKVQKQIIKDPETGKIVEQGYQDAPFVRVVVQKLVFLAQGYLIKGAPLYHNQDAKKAITDIMDDLAEKYYYEGQQQYFNWWFYEIGIPRDLNKLMSVLAKVYEEELSSTDKLVAQNYQDKFTKWTSGLNYFLPNARYGGAAPTAIIAYFPVENKRIQTGANVIDTAKIIIASGLLSGNMKTVDDSILAMYDNLFREFVEAKDGFYYDGSFIQHDYLPYIGSYGEVLFSGMADLFNYFKGSALDLSKDKRFERLYKFIELSVMPFMYKMSIPDGLSGRSIVRPGYSDKEKGMRILGYLTVFEENAPETYKARLHNFIRSQLAEFTNEEITAIGKAVKVNPTYVEKLIQIKVTSDIPEAPRDDLDWKFYESFAFDKYNEKSTSTPSNSSKPNYPVGYDLFRKQNGMWFTRDQARYVWKNDKFMFNINLRDQNVGFPEATLGENVDSYYQADGSTFIHTPNWNDRYANNYFVGINSDEIPGTSSIKLSLFNDVYKYVYPIDKGIDVTKLPEEDKKAYDKFMNSYEEKNKVIEDKISLSTNDTYSNGMISDGIGFVSSKIQNWNKTLYTKKAYFMIENQIVVIGQVNTKGENVTTTLENVKDDFSAPTIQVKEETLTIDNHAKMAKSFVISPKNGEKSAYIVFGDGAKATLLSKEVTRHPYISNKNRTFFKEKDPIKSIFHKIYMTHNETNRFMYSIVPNYDETTKDSYTDVLSNIKVIKNDSDMIIVSYTRLVDGKKKTSYYISSFMEPDPTKINSRSNIDQEFEDKVQAGFFIPGLEKRVHIKTPANIIIDTVEGSDLIDIQFSSSKGDDVSSFTLSGIYNKVASKMVVNKNLTWTNSKAMSEVALSKYKNDTTLNFYNTFGEYNAIKHNFWVTIKEIKNDK